MSTLFPFPTNLARAIGEEPIMVVAHDNDGTPTVVCVSAHSPAERAIALALLADHPTSFVVSHGRCYTPDGEVRPSQPTCPRYAGELSLTFEVEWVTQGSQPEVYVFTHTEQEWDTARQAMQHLLRLGRLSMQSYLEGTVAGVLQGLSAHHLDGTPHAPWLVEQFREAAICAQHAECERMFGDTEDADLVFLSVLMAQEPREHHALEDEAGWKEGEETAEVDVAQWEEDAATEEGVSEEPLSQAATPPSRPFWAALARWWKGGEA